MKTFLPLLLVLVLFFPPPIAPCASSAPSLTSIRFQNFCYFYYLLLQQKHLHENILSPLPWRQYRTERQEQDSEGGPDGWIRLLPSLLSPFSKEGQSSRP